MPPPRTPPSPTPLPTPVSDGDLVRLARRGHLPAFEALVRRHQDALYSHLAYRLQDRHAAEDLAQEVLVAAFQSLDRFDPERPFRPWLLGIAGLRLRQHWRQTQRRQQHEASSPAGDEGLLSPGWDLPDDPAQRPEAVVERQLTQAAMLAALSGMEDRYRSVLLLRFQEDLSYDRIAETLQLPLNTVRTWIRRGKEQLRRRVFPTLKSDAMP